MFKHRTKFDTTIFKKYSNRYKEILGIKGLFNISAIDLDHLYRKLIRRLDKESIKTVNRILERVMIYRGVSLPANITPEQLQPEHIPAIKFDKKEQKIIHCLLSEFETAIKPLPDGVFQYQNYKLPINHFEVNVFWHQCSVHMLKNKKKIKNANIIDVGAFVGDSSIVLSRYTNHNVYAFEPVRSNYNLMLKTLTLNPELKNIKPLNVALGSENSVSNICFAESSSSFAFDLTNNHEEVTVLTLDDFVEQNHLQIGLIKVDIEGFEQSFLQGAIRTIKNQRPSLIISIYHNADDFFKIKPMIESWNLGYKFRISKPIDGQILYETVLLAETDK